MIFRNDEVPDILKPVYMYGGISTPQKIMERVYSAERTTDESLGLVTSKRTTVWQTNMDAFMADFDGNREKFKRGLQLVITTVLRLAIKTMTSSASTTRH